MTMNHPCHGVCRNRPTPQPPIEPPEVPQCLWCDGQCTVEVDSVTDVSGKVQRLGPFSYNTVAPEIDCPHCDGTGNEPPPDPMDDPRIP